MNAWANLHILVQPNTLLITVRTRPPTVNPPHGRTSMKGGGFTYQLLTRTQWKNPYETLKILIARPRSNKSAGKGSLSAAETKQDEGSQFNGGGSGPHMTAQVCIQIHESSISRQALVA
jgi:hypothetical protein